MTSTPKREAAIAVALLVFAGASAILLLAGPLAYPDSVVVPTFIVWCTVGVIVVVLGAQLSRADDDVRFVDVVRRSFKALAVLVGWFG